MSTSLYKSLLNDIKLLEEDEIHKLINFYELVDGLNSNIKEANDIKERNATFKLLQILIHDSLKELPDAHEAALIEIAKRL